MYVVRHFAFVSLTIARNSYKLEFWLRGAWLWLFWDLLVWSRDLVSLLLTGKRKVECECCGWRGTRFFLHTCLSGAKVHRFKEEACPSCGALKRQRQLVRHLAGKIGGSLPKTARILAVGPGRAELRWLRRQGRADLVTVDIRSGIAMAVMDMSRMAFRDGCFDLVLCSHVVEHVTEDFAAMKEMWRVLKRGGTCLIQVPIRDGLPTTVEYGKPNREEFDHVRAYGADFKGRLEAAGFVVSHSDDELFEATKSA